MLNILRVTYLTLSVTVLEAAVRVN